ncbi:MAG: AAC(3) family N-acetyltransferase [Clostridia bacterium]
MSDSGLFVDSTGVWHIEDEIHEALLALNAQDCDVLFVHSDISFGLPNRSYKRKEYLGKLFDIIIELGVQTVVFPTFTYSFCNSEVYDVNNSATSMGALNEYARKQADAVRSLDPLLSVVAFGEQRERLTQGACDNSLGHGSILDKLHHTSNVKFLFFGAEFSNSFTYVHYVEKMMNVPYRFDMVFDGTIVDHDGRRYPKTQAIHTACGGIVPIDFYHFKDSLRDSGQLRIRPLGDREIAIITEPNAYQAITEKINGRIDYFLERPFTQKDLEHRYTYDRTKARITHC